MGSLTTILEGVSVGFLAAVVLMLIIIIILKRTRDLKRLQSDMKDYTKLDDESSNTEFLQDRDMDKCSLPLTKLTPVQPHRAVKWAEPVTEVETKPRSASCPLRRHAIVELNLKSDDEVQKSAETPSLNKRKPVRKYRRSKTDSCYHVCQIQFTVFYNYYHSKLTVQLGSAVNVPSSFGVTYGSYMQLELLPKSEKASTKIQMHTNNPVFGETVEFPGITSDELLNMSLKLRLCTVDRFSHSTLVGQVIAPLEELDISPKKPTIVWRPITSSYQQSKISSSLLSLREITERGDLTLSLKYQVLTNRITVVIMKAVSLPNISKIFAIDPYVVVKLLLNLKTVQTKKTTIKRRTTSPCWNEPLVFEIDSKIPISEYSMSFKVKSHNSLSEDLTVGEIELGYHVDGARRQHWRDMIVSKNQDRAMCHKIM